MISNQNELIGDQQQSVRDMPNDLRLDEDNDIILVDKLSKKQQSQMNIDVRRKIDAYLENKILENELKDIFSSID